jgi:hypothetical protein
VILKETNAGLTFSFSDKTSIKQHLLELYKKFKTGELSNIKNNAEKYSHRQLVKQIVTQLDRITKQ